MTALAVGLEEASAMLGISARTLRKWAGDGRVPSCKLGRRLLFRVKDLEMVLAQAVRHGESGSQLKVAG